MYLFFLGFLTVLGFVSTAAAQVEHQLLRRVPVFPIQTELTRPNSFSTTTGPDFTGSVKPEALDEAWWQVREQLTESRRLLVASKQFLIKNDVFQPRGELQPADVILLGKLLDAHALVTIQLKGRQLEMRAYDGSNGFLLWNKSLGLHPSLTISDQIAGVARRLARDFTASIPYQAFTVLDPLVGKVVFEEGDVQLAQIDAGVTGSIKTGDPVQWIRITTTNAAALFQGGGRLVVFAEGRVVKVEQGIATIEILRATSLDEIKEFSLVRLPVEAERLRRADLISDDVRGTFSVELVQPELTPAELFKRENKPLVATMSWISSLAALLLLAF